jgi:hypothetical protein
LDDLLRRRTRRNEATMQRLLARMLPQREHDRGA